MWITKPLGEFPHRQRNDAYGAYNGLVNMQMQELGTAMQPTQVLLIPKLVHFISEALASR
jgi:hypothetical protein